MTRSPDETARGETRRRRPRITTYSTIRPGTGSFLAPAASAGVNRTHIIDRVLIWQRELCGGVLHQRQPLHRAATVTSDVIAIWS